MKLSPSRILLRALMRAQVMVPLLCAVTLPVSAARADEACVGCHVTRAEARLRAPVRLSAGDAHQRGEVFCSDCHGGDPDERSASAHDPGRGFIGRPDGVGVAQLCGRCHDGSTDAAAVTEPFRAGAHGDTLAGGRFAATCTSCHGAHGIEALDPQIAREQCVTCHADPIVMSESGLPTDQFEEWSESVHGEELLTEDTPTPACAHCHDPHQNEAGLEAVAACGECHDEVRAAFDAGPHAEAFGRLGFLDCVECHGSHEVAAPDAQMLAGLRAVCLRCHGEGQPAFERVQLLTSFASDVDRARSVTEPDDPRRLDMVRAMHALDPSALEAALAVLSTIELPPETREEDDAPELDAGRPPSSRSPAWLGLALAVGVAALALLAVAAIGQWRGRR